MITVEFIKETLNKAQISGISGIIIKNDKAFITLEITKKDDTSSIENSISYALQSYIDKSNINLIFTNKDGSFQGKKKTPY